MSITAIIAEYNPFHAGHAYQIREARKLTDCDHVLVIMSGNYVQRGAPAIMNKHDRTRLALMGGADLVIELPGPYATASSIDFAMGAVRILNGLGCVDYLCFGTEDGELSHLQAAAHLFLEEPPEFSKALKAQLSKGASYPKARMQAFEIVSRSDSSFLTKPNNNLAISYLMALEKTQSRIKPVTVKRLGDFNNENLTGSFASASAIRKTLEESNSYPESIDAYLADRPSADFIRDHFLKDYPLTAEDFYPLLLGRLINEEKSLTEFMDLSEEMKNRLVKHYLDAGSFETLSSSVKTSIYTKTRIDRALFHVLLDIRKDQLQPDYARILGFSKSHRNVLTELMNKSSIPVLMKALPDQNFDPALIPLYEREIRNENLYEAVRKLKYPMQPAVNAYSRPIIVL